MLDEADRMVDMGFEDDVREIISYFKVPKHDGSKGQGSLRMCVGECCVFSFALGGAVAC